MAQDDYYYEIQLTNKQLVFYFMAGAAGLILSFLAGVMVGRGVEGGNVAAAGAEQTTKVAEEKVVTEQTPAPAPTDYSYPQRLESEKGTEGLERPATTAGAAAAPASAAPTVAPTTRPTPASRPTPTPAAALPTPPTRTTATAPAAAAPATTPATTSATTSASLPKALGPNAKGFAVQVGAFKDKAGADAIVKSLKSRGLPAFTVAPAARSGGLFTVRVGVYRDRADAETVLERLRDDKFKPYVIKQ